MEFYRVGFAVLLLCLVGVFCEKAVRSRTERRVHLPLLGLGPTCSGCPQHFCEDDPAIVHGYCCGCARFYDNLPVGCSPYLQCPPNTYALCEDYEYMMHCCCS